MITEPTPAPVEVVARPAIDGCAETRVCCVLELLARLWSGVLLETVAVFVIVATDDGVTITVTVAVALLRIVPRLQAMAFVPPQVPWLDVVDTNATPAGSVSFTITSAASSGPGLLTVSV